MHIEIQVALNFVISYLYNKLPRRRVNLFGEELERALKERFQGHWYPETPFKGSAFRCLKTGDPIDKVLARAARESGVPIQDVLENLPQELAVWVDPGEVSYRIGEKGAVKILFSDKGDPHDERCADREVTRTFNPEAQCFRPIDAVGCSLGNLTLSPKALAQQQQQPQPQPQPAPAYLAALSAPNAPAAAAATANQIAPASAAPSPTASAFKESASPIPAFIPRTTTPLTFTTATFAQTKFGSTKLKTNSKRANRMSPTEFSNYIKQRAMQQQIHQQPASARALSPDPSYYYNHGPYAPPFPPRALFESSSALLNAPDLHAAGKAVYEPPLYASGGPTAKTSPAGAPSAPAQDKGKLMDNWTYPSSSSQYQHLLLAN